MITFSINNLIGKGTTRKVYRAEDQKYVVKEIIPNCKYNQNFVEWNIYKYANQSQYGQKIYNHLNPCLHMENNYKYIIAPYCQENKEEIPWTIFGTQVQYFWDYKMPENWGFNQNKLKLIDYGYMGNLYVIRDLEIFKQLLIELQKLN
jgi:hypothetical protein